MTDHEVQILTELATDMKWLKCAVEENARANNSGHETIIEHLAALNGQVGDNKTRSKINRYGLAINFSVVAIIITILLHLMGVY